MQALVNLLAFCWTFLKELKVAVFGVVVPVMPCCDQTILKTLLSSLFPLICIAVIVILLFLFWRCRQPSYIEQIEAARDKPLLPASPPSPLPAASLRTIKLLEEKARGRYGSVHKAQMGGELVAVKVFPCQVRHSWVDERDFYNLPHINNHDNILRFIAAEKREPQYWLITEFHHRGSLYDHLKGKTVSWNEARRIMVTMTNGLVFLHGNLPTTELLPGKPSIAHRDLKSRNILLKDDMSACLADFGLALVLNGDMDTLPGQVGRFSDVLGSMWVKLWSSGLSEDVIMFGIFGDFEYLSLLLDILAWKQFIFLIIIIVRRFITCKLLYSL